MSKKGVVDSRKQKENDRSEKIKVKAEVKKLESQSKFLYDYFLSNKLYVDELINKRNRLVSTGKEKGEVQYLIHSEAQKDVERYKHLMSRVGDRSDIRKKKTLDEFDRLNAENNRLLEKSKGRKFSRKTEGQYMYWKQMCKSYGSAADLANAYQDECNRLESLNSLILDFEKLKEEQMDLQLAVKSRAEVKVLESQLTFLTYYSSFNKGYIDGIIEERNWMVDSGKKKGEVQKWIHLEVQEDAIRYENLLSRVGNLPDKGTENILDVFDRLTAENNKLKEKLNGRKINPKTEGQYMYWKQMCGSYVSAAVLANAYQDECNRLESLNSLILDFEKLVRRTGEMGPFTKVKEAEGEGVEQTVVDKLMKAYEILYKVKKERYPPPQIYEDLDTLPLPNDYMYDDSVEVDGRKVTAVGPSGSSTGQGANSSQDKLGSLFRPPLELMHTGSFEKAKFTAKSEDKWFLVNVQSSKEFSSLKLNRDTWGNEAVAQTISSNFIFWQVYNYTEDGRKVCTDYELEGAPVTLVINPFTGNKIHSWRGMIQPDNLLNDLVSFLDASPNKYYASLSHERPEESSHSTPQKIQEVPDVGVEEEELQRALAASMGNKDAVVKSDKEVVKADNSDIKEKQSKPSYPPLPEEPKVADKNLLCMVGVRLPDGRMLQRNFLLTDPIQLLWSFCYSQFDEAEARPFELTQAIRGASISLDYAKNLTFDESGLANSMVSVTWE